jgi:hypothetical protein
MFWVGLSSRRRLLPPEVACTRCGHAVAFHHKPHACTYRLNITHLWHRCPCEGYLPPGISPVTGAPDLADLS